MSAFLDSIVARAKAQKKTIVLPEGDDPRTLEDVDAQLLDQVGASVRSAHVGSGTASTVIDCTQ